MAPKFTPIPPEGFEIAGTFEGVTTAVGPGGVPRIRYQIRGAQFRSGGLVGFAMRQVLKTGVGDEVALGSLHTRLEFALAMVGSEPEAGLPERHSDDAASGWALGRYKDRETGAMKFGAMALAKTPAGMAEILVTHCDTEDRARQLIQDALAPYV